MSAYKSSKDVIEILNSKDRIPCVIFLNNNFFVVIIQNKYFFKIITTI